MATPSSSAVPLGAGAPKATRSSGWKITLACSLFSLIAIFALDAYSGLHSKAGPLTSAPFWLPYLFVILRLRGRKQKSGLALAIAMSGAILGPAVWLIAYARSWDADWRIQMGLAALAAAQVLLARAAIREWRRLPRETGDNRTLIANLTYGVIAFAILVWFLKAAPNRIAEDEKVTIHTLQAIHKAAASYASQFGGVYPAHLSALGSPADDSAVGCDASGLVWWRLGNSQVDRFEPKGGGYGIEYHAGAPVITANNCKGAQHYIVRARPVIFRKTGRRSFLIDETGTIRGTTENRPAGMSDSPIFLPQ